LTAITGYDAGRLDHGGNFQAAAGFRTQGYWPVFVGLPPSWMNLISRAGLAWPLANVEAENLIRGSTNTSVATARQELAAEVTLYQAQASVAFDDGSRHEIISNNED
jgi:hypothetical protein